MMLQPRHVLHSSAEIPITFAVNKIGIASNCLSSKAALHGNQPPRLTAMLLSIRSNLMHWLVANCIVLMTKCPYVKCACFNTLLNVWQVLQGRVVESGTHSSLLAKQGKYASMWSRQANVDDASALEMLEKHDKQEWAGSSQDQKCFKNKWWQWWPSSWGSLVGLHRHRGKATVHARCKWIGKPQNLVQNLYNECCRKWTTQQFCELQDLMSYLNHSALCWAPFFVP